MEPRMACRGRPWRVPICLKLQMPGTASMQSLSPRGDGDGPEIDPSQCGVGGCGQDTEGCHPAVVRRHQPVNEQSRRGGTDVSGRTGSSVYRGVIRSLVRCYFCGLVCRQAATQLLWEALAPASLGVAMSDR